MLLNRNYYLNLWEKYQNIEMLTSKLNDNASILSLKMILEHCRNKKPLHINFQNSETQLREIAQHLYVELSNDIYLNYADLPRFVVGQKLKSKRDNKYYQISNINGNHYTLKEDPRKSKNFQSTNTILPDLTYDSIVKRFFQVDAGISEQTINNYIDFFKGLNHQNTDFLQTYFERKSVFIASRTFWDEPTFKKIRKTIPSIYLPNPNDGGFQREEKSIDALPDNIMYVIPKYEVCYDKILRQDKKVDTIVIYDTEEKAIEQIIQDKNQYRFNLIVLTNSSDPIKCGQIPCWNWYKEEIEIINTL